MDGPGHRRANGLIRDVFTPELPLVNREALVSSAGWFASVKTLNSGQLLPSWSNRDLNRKKLTQEFKSCCR